MSSLPDLSSAYLSIIKHHYQKECPVDVVAIARAFDIDVWSTKELTNGFSGAIRRSKEGKLEIIVNENHPLTRQRFTIAHELGHALLHADKIGDGVADNILLRSSKLSNPVEREADAFAAEILMPMHLLEPMLTEGKFYPSIKDLAARFNVSPTAMAVRIGILGWPSGQAEERD